MNALISVITCEKNKAKAQECRDTWAPKLANRSFDVRFFLARQERQPKTDEVFLDCLDDYDGLPAKVKAMCRWAVEQGYETVFKCDDDTDIQANKFEIPDAEYAGLASFRPVPYCSGGGYFLRNQALKVIAGAPLNGELFEDRWVGFILSENNILPVKLNGYIAPHQGSNYSSDYVVLIRWGT